MVKPLKLPGLCLCKDRVFIFYEENTRISWYKHGSITAISPGKATITATAADSSGPNCTVTVTHGTLTHTPKQEATCTAAGTQEF